MREYDIVLSQNNDGYCFRIDLQGVSENEIDFLKREMLDEIMFSIYTSPYEADELSESFEENYEVATLTVTEDGNFAVNWDNAATSEIF